MLGLTDKLFENKTLLYLAVALAALVAGLLVLLLFRLAFGRRLRFSNAGRARQARLGLVDAFDLDRQRQLIIVRRDNVEHLILIGGPNDLLIESEIVRAEPARELTRGREKEPDARPALPIGLGVEPAAVSIVPSSAAPSSVQTQVSGPLQSLAAAAEPVSATTIPPVNVNARPRETPNDAPAAAPQPLTPTIAPPPPSLAKDPPLPRAPLFPLPPRRPVPPLARPPIHPAGARIEPGSLAAPQTTSVGDDTAGGVELSPMPPLPRPGQLPPRAPGFLRPPPLRQPARPSEASIAPTMPGTAKDEPPLIPSEVARTVTIEPPPVVAEAPLVASAGAPPVQPAEAADPFDSIEEEMAKLLGRKSDKS